MKQVSPARRHPRGYVLRPSSKRWVTDRLCQQALSAYSGEAGCPHALETLIRHDLCHIVTGKAVVEAHKSFGREWSQQERILVVDGWRLVFPEVARDDDPAMLEAAKGRGWASGLSVRLRVVVSKGCVMEMVLCLSKFLWLSSCLASIERVYSRIPVECRCNQRRTPPCKAGTGRCRFHVPGRTPR